MSCLNFYDYNEPIESQYEFQGQAENRS